MESSTRQRGAWRAAAIGLASFSLVALASAPSTAVQAAGGVQEVGAAAVAASQGDSSSLALMSVVPTPSRHAVSDTRTETEVYPAEAFLEAQTVCVRVGTPRGARKKCKSVPVTSEPQSVEFCVRLKAKKYRGQKFCRTITVRPAPTPAPEPEPILAPPFTPPNLDDSTLDGSPDDFTILLTSAASGEPYRFDPCTEITWSVVGTAEQAEKTRAAVIEWSAASGLAVREVPPAPADNRLSVALAVYWGTQEEYPLLAAPDNVIRAGIASHQTEPGGWVTSAQVYIRADLPDVFHWDKPRDVVFHSILLHELGHVAGLGHAADRSQVMWRVAGPSSYQRGDLAGLAYLRSFRQCRLDTY